jgi:hypothetical protein
MIMTAVLRVDIDMVLLLLHETYQARRLQAT